MTLLYTILAVALLIVLVIKFKVGHKIVIEGLIIGVVTGIVLALITNVDYRAALGRPIVEFFRFTRIPKVLKINTEYISTEWVDITEPRLIEDKEGREEYEFKATNVVTGNTVSFRTNDFDDVPPDLKYTIFDKYVLETRLYKATKDGRLVPDK